MIKKILAGLFFLIVLAQVVLANSLVSKGSETRSLLEGRELLRSEILALDNQIARASSLGVIRKKAEKMGMGPARLQFLPPPPVALAP